MKEGLVENGEQWCGTFLILVQGIQPPPILACQYDRLRPEGINNVVVLGWSHASLYLRALLLVPTVRCNRYLNRNYLVVHMEDCCEDDVTLTTLYVSIVQNYNPSSELSWGPFDLSLTIQAGFNAVRNVNSKAAHSSSLSRGCYRM